MVGGRVSVTDGAERVPPDLAAAWDARMAQALERAPRGLSRGVTWLRQPSKRWLRLPAGGLLILGGCFSILPVLGLWMLPLGLALLGEDHPPFKVALERAAGWGERRWQRLRRRSS